MPSQPKPRRLEYVPLESLVQHEANPKGHDLELIRKSMTRFGYTEPVLWCERAKVLAAGHGRLEVLATWKAAGGDPPEGVMVNRRGQWLVPEIRGWSSKDDTELRAYLVADNETTIAGGWVRDRLADILADLAVRPAGLEGVGFDRPDVDSLLADLGRPPLPGTNAEPLDTGDGPEPPSTIPQLTREGDLIVLGRHRLLCGNAEEADQRARLLGGAKAAIVYMDPPYGMALQTDYKLTHKGHGPDSKWGQSNTFDAVIGDDRPYEAAPIIEAFSTAREQFWWGADYYRDTIPLGGSWLVWDKRTHDDEPKFDNVLGNHFELCWSAVSHRRRLLRYTWSGLHGVHGIGEEHRRFHPTQKPVALALDLLGRYSKPGETVADLYAGSGSTLIACERLGLSAVVAELSPLYCDVIAWRWQRASGELAARDGEPLDYSVTA